MKAKHLFFLFLLPLTLFADFSDERLELYYRPTCPYCVKVLKVIKKLQAPVELKNISDNSDNFNTLISIGGKRQVPCLFINGRPMYESNEIISWLQKEAELSHPTRDD